MSKKQPSFLELDMQLEESQRIPGLYYRNVTFDQIEEYRDLINKQITDGENDGDVMQWIFDNAVCDKNGEYFPEQQLDPNEYMGSLQSFKLKALIAEMTELYGFKKK